jgi:hypothetical protein
VAFPLPVRDFHPLEAPSFAWRTIDCIEHFDHPGMSQTTPLDHRCRVVSRPGV